MKKLSLFEASIIGFLSGVVIATYLIFITSTSGFIGNILGLISLRPLLDKIHLPDSQLLIGSFIFFVLVYTLYGALIGLLIHITNKTKIILSLLAVVIIGGGTEQITGMMSHTPISNEIYPQTAAVIKSFSNVTKQYFGTEATGDLNADRREDVAFLIHRNDSDRGTLYYLAAALDNENGKSGTNLLFLGNNVFPTHIAIASSTIIVDYAQSKNSTSTKQFYARLINDALTEAHSATTPTATTTDSI
ncbi:MAG: hypothetical protein PHG25_01325 [Candidatus Pacebacteria bacterium]|nr:hypothetical protein [Candidatus Paceibacterota bacterium]